MGEKRLLADARVDAKFHCEFELGSDAICTADKNGILIADCLEVEGSSKTANISVGSNTLRRFHEGLDCLDKRIPCINGDTCSSVRQAFFLSCLECTA